MEAQPKRRKRCGRFVCGRCGCVHTSTQKPRGPQRHSCGRSVPPLLPTYLAYLPAYLAYPWAHSYKPMAFLKQRDIVVQFAPVSFQLANRRQVAPTAPRTVTETQLTPAPSRWPRAVHTTEQAVRGARRCHAVAHSAAQSTVACASSFAGLWMVADVRPIGRRALRPRRHRCGGARPCGRRQLPVNAFI